MHSYTLNNLDIRTAAGDLGLQPIVYEYRCGMLDSLIHAHRFIEIHYLLHGQVRFTLDGISEELAGGDLLIISPGTRHSEEIVSSGGECAVCFSFSHRLLRGREHDPDAWAMLDHFSTHTYERRHISPAVMNLLDRISTEYTARGAACASMLRLLIAELVLETLRLAAPVSAPTHHALPPKNISDRSEILINAYFQDVFTGKISGSAEELAALLYISPRQLGRLLHRMRGMSFLELRNAHRLEGAAQLLRQSSLSILDVAERMGYCSPSAFCAAFKKHTDVTPLGYRHRPFDLHLVDLDAK